MLHCFDKITFKVLMQNQENIFEYLFILAKNNYFNKYYNKINFLYIMCTYVYIAMLKGDYLVEIHKQGICNLMYICLR